MWARFGSSALVTELVDHYGTHRLRHFYRRIDRLDVLIVDEMGYGHFSELGTQLLFEMLRAGYERTSLIITTALPLEKWGKVFENESGARSVADRLTDRGHLLELTGDPYWKPGRNAIVSPQFRTF